MEWKQDSKSSQDFGDRRTMMHELQRASDKRAFVGMSELRYFALGGYCQSLAERLT
jgi:hypothetical protein